MSATPPASRARSPRAVRTLLAVVAAVLLVAGCSGQQKTPTDYTASMKQNFLQGCERPQGNGKDTIKNSRTECTCIYNGIVKNIPFDDFKKVNEDLSSAPKTLPAQMQKIIAGCTEG